MSLNYNDKVPGGINKNTNVTDDQEPKEIFTNKNVTYADTDTKMGSNNDAIFKIFVLSMETKIIPQI